MFNKHWTAVRGEYESAQEIAVDSWYDSKGDDAFMIPIKQWLRGASPHYKERERISDPPTGAPTMSINPLHDIFNPRALFEKFQAMTEQVRRAVIEMRPVDESVSDSNRPRAAIR